MGDRVTVHFVQYIFFVQKAWFWVNTVYSLPSKGLGSFPFPIVLGLDVMKDERGRGKGMELPQLLFTLKWESVATCPKERLLCFPYYVYYIVDSGNRVPFFNHIRFHSKYHSPVPHPTVPLDFMKWNVYPDSLTSLPVPLPSTLFSLPVLFYTRLDSQTLLLPSGCHLVSFLKLIIKSTSICSVFLSCALQL
jgi:hypothetical protein